MKNNKQIMKKCTRCGQDKPLNCFYDEPKNEFNIYGKSFWCKKCKSSYGKRKYLTMRRERKRNMF